MTDSREEQSGVGRFVNNLEETAIAVLLGLMTIVTFINVVLRYLFNSSLIWGLEVTLALFAWLVLLGMSYAVKKKAHLGVDAIINFLSPGPRRIMGLIAAVLCVVYALLLLKGAWDYWAPFAGLDKTSGRWFPTGFEETRDQAFYMTEQIPMPGFLKWMEDAFNYGEPYDKLPRMIPYFILPFGVALLLVRCVQAGIAIAQGRRDSMIVSHEAEDAIDDVRHMNEEG